MQISSANDAITSSGSPIRPNTGPTASNVADAGPPVVDSGDGSKHRDRFADALLRRIDAGDLRGPRDAGREFRFGRKLVQRTRREVGHALRDGAKDLVKGVKDELRSVLRELGDDKETRKAVRSAFKDFRHDVKDLVRETKSSRLFDANEIGGDLEAAYNDFRATLEAALGSRSGRAEESDPADAPSIVPTGSDAGTGVIPDTNGADAPSIVPAGSDPGTGVTPDATGSGAPPVVERPPASVAETRPDPEPRFGDLFSRLDAGFKSGLGDLVSRINGALERAHEAFDRFRERGFGGHRGHDGRGRSIDRAA